MRSMRTILALLLLTACSAKEANGVWVAFIDDLENDERVASTFTHNYLDAQRIVDTTVDDWTDVDVQDQSEQVLFLEVFDVVDVDGDFDKVMVVEGTILLGVREEDGTWTFSWTYSTDETNTQAHVSGYAYTTHYTEQLVWSLNVDLAGDVGTGTVRLDQTVTVTWDESDLWNAAETGTNEGETPVWQVLEHTSDGTPVENDGDATDCSAAICNLATDFVDGGGGPITLRSTDLTHDEFEAVYGSEQVAGIPDFF